MRVIAALLWVGLLLGLNLTSLQAESPDTVYVERPDISRCDPGVLAEAEKTAVLATLNRIRRLHNLEPVAYAAGYDDEVAASSLIIAANNEITHFPPAGSACYSEAGARGAAGSNLAWSYPTEASGTALLAPSANDIRSWLIDPNVPELGHRRWLLDPFLDRVAYGRVDAAPVGRAVNQYAHGAALMVNGQDLSQPPLRAPEFIAYPYGLYPLDLFEIGWYWSFSAVADAGDYWANDEVDFTNATVRVSGATGDLRVHSQAANNEAIGLPNLLQWQVDGVEIGETYEVEIAGVGVAGGLRTYAYEVTLTAPDWTDLNMPVYTLEQLNEVIEVRAGSEFALYAPPPVQIPNRYTISRREMTVQMADHSPYIKIFRVGGTIGDEILLPFGQQNVTLRIVETTEGIRNPLLALRRALGIPVYKVSGLGETFTAIAGRRFALYFPPEVAVQGVQRVRWSQPAGTELSVDFYSARVLMLEVIAGRPGAEATVYFGDDGEFYIEVGRQR